MTTIIILIVLSIVLYFTRNFWSSFIVSMIKSKKNVVVDDLPVFSPRGTVRTFVIGIDIEEIGDGTAKISLTKYKDN